MSLNTQGVKIELHGFCDIPEKAYASVTYLRIISYDTIISLITSKTTVAPLKELTLPKLEEIYYLN